MSQIENEYEAVLAVLAKAEADGTLTQEGRLTLAKMRQQIQGGFGGAVGQGLTLNAADEIYGTLRGFSGSADDATKTVNAYMGTQYTPGEIARAQEAMAVKGYRESNPKSAMAGEMLGAAIPALVPTGATQANLVARTGMALGTGAISGVMDADREDMVSAGLTGGGISAGAEATLGAISKPLGATYRAIKGAIKGPSRLGQEQARQLIREAAANDSGTLDDALLKLAQASGKPYTLADMGPNSMGLLDAVNVLPGPGKRTAQKFLNERDLGMPTRLKGDLQEAFGQRASWFETFTALRNARKENGDVLYNAAYRKKIPVQPQLTALLSRPSMKSAFSRAYEIAAEEGINLPKVVMDASGRLVTSTGGVVKEIDTKFLHYIKMGLDDLAFTGASPSNAAGIGGTQLTAIKGTRAELLDYLDASNPAYKTARNFWAGSTATMHAMKNGRDIFTMNPDELLEDLTKMSRAEKEAFRLGAMDAVLQKSGGYGAEDAVMAMAGNPARNLLKDPKKVALIKMTFPDTDKGRESYATWVENFLRESDMKSTSATVQGNSRTAARQEAVSSIKDGAQRVIPEGLGSLIMSTIRGSAADLETRQLEAVGDEVVKLLTKRANNPDELAQLKAALEKGGGIKALMAAIPETVPVLARVITGPQAVGVQSGQVGASLYAGDNKPGPVEEMFPGLLFTP